MGFWLKKAVSTVLMPLPASLLLGVLGLWWLRREETRRRGRRALLAGVVLLWLAALPPMSWVLLAPLEAGQLGYVPVDRPVAAIAVLGAGYHPVAGRPPTGQVSAASVVRVAEAMRIARLHPEARVHCSGWGGRFGGSNARAACDIGISMGLAATRVVLHPDARDTEEEALAVRRAVGDGEVVLVTHAAHMPRARALFERCGVRVIPAPTGHVSPADPGWSPVPGSFSLATTTAAWREWLGRGWVGLKALLR